ncbi:16856_t:CDS:2, partial [Acaulospora morrowiae]
NAKSDPNGTEGNMEEQKLEVSEETSSSGDIRNKILVTADT